MKAFAMELYMDRCRSRDPELEEEWSIVLKRAIEKSEKVTRITKSIYSN